MLPDFPAVKSMAMKLHARRFKSIQNNSLGPFNSAPRQKIHEGSKLILKREDGTVEEILMKELSAHFEIPYADIENGLPEEVFRKIDSAAQDIAKQMKIHSYEEIRKAVEKVGNVTKTEGKQLTIKDLFNVIEKVQIDFDDDGKPYMPTIVAGTEATERIIGILQQLDANPSLKEEFDKLIDKKKEEWRDRESNRKLVG